MLVGLGAESDITVDTWRKLGGRLRKEASAVGAEEIALVFSPDKETDAAAGALVLLVAGLALTLLLSGGPVKIGPIGFNLYWMLLGLTCATLGYSCVQIGVLARILHRLRPGIARRIQAVLTYNRGMTVAAVCTVFGLGLGGVLLAQYIAGGLRLSAIWHPAILGLLLIILGFQTFCFTLLIEMTQRLASVGYAAVAPELYHRDGPDCQDDGPTRRARLLDVNVIKDVNATVDFLQTHRAIDAERLGIIGFCMGGRVTYLMAAANPSFKAAVAYYGGNIMVPWGEGAAPFERTA